jgi:light-regulated signal transduction histidine kinase (bacteriophytochrome)
VTLQCRDGGIGFEPQYAERIFGVFQRLHGRDRYGGAGIGLSICRKICDRHGGTIHAQGWPQQGASFTIRLPRRHRADV